ncbi:unnamed protein product [Enterobius vermicularis]|uniref:Autophagy-related protein 2 n=1 Tax=Enterobius vermicularis TaxID=51028 RepID=A0A0N4VN77_ENTVE|nr:unnamed protein product [Enterobius vermicularis]
MDQIANRACSFLVRRYLSDFLKTKIDSNNFSCSLSKGSAAVKTVEFDTELLNQSLRANNVPLEIEDGFIDEIDVSVPFGTSSTGSFEITINGLQMTLHPRKTLDEINEEDLVTSVLDSVIDSMSTSMEIAEKFVKDEVTAGENGVSKFAEIIDRLASQLRVVFLDTTIRVETYPEPTSGLCTCIELQIECLEFIDGQMDQKQGKKPLSGGDLSNNECDSPAKISEDKDSVDNSFYETTRTVLEQPMPTRGMANLDKVIHTKGIRLFTDIFFRDYKENDEETQPEGPVAKSGEPSSPALKNLSPVPPNFEDSVTQPAFFSCYSSIGPSSDDSVILNSIAFPAVVKLNSNPIQFAEFTGDKQSVYIHISGGDKRDKPPNQKIRLELDGLFIFATPTQIELIHDLLQLMLGSKTEDENANYPNAALTDGVATAAIGLMLDQLVDRSLLVKPAQL